MFHLVYRIKSKFIEGSEFETQEPLSMPLESLYGAIMQARSFCETSGDYLQEMDKKSMRLWRGPNVYAVYGEIDRFQKKAPK